MNVLPTCSGFDAPFTCPSRTGRKKFVFDSTVTVVVPSGRFRNAQIAPRVSANAISAPPCNVPTAVQRSSAHAILPRTSDGSAEASSIPSLEANGIFRMKSTKSKGLAPGSGHHRDHPFRRRTLRKALAQLREERISVPPLLGKNQLARIPRPQDADGTAVDEEALTGDVLRLVAGERDDDRGDVRRVHDVEAILWLRDLPERGFRHARAGVRCETVDRHAVACELLRGDHRERRYRGLRRAVVRLADVPEHTGRAGGVDHAAADLFASLGALTPVRGGVTRRCEMALEVDVQNGVPLVLAHVHEHALARASPPAAPISSTTSWAGVSFRRSPASETPRSLTTTLAPASARANACSRPMPRPAPVTIATFPSRDGTAIPSYHASCREVKALRRGARRGRPVAADRRAWPGNVGVGRTGAGVRTALPHHRL